MTSFTVKARLSEVTPGNTETRLNFTANYTDPNTGERVNQDWAEVTPSWNNQMWVMNHLVERLGLEVGQNYTLTYERDNADKE